MSYILDESSIIIVLELNSIPIWMKWLPVLQFFFFETKVWGLAGARLDLVRWDLRTLPSVTWSSWYHHIPPDMIHICHSIIIVLYDIYSIDLMYCRIVFPNGLKFSIIYSIYDIYGICGFLFWPSQWRLKA